MNESSLLTGPLEPTNQWYAVAKIAGIKMCQAYALQYGFNAISVMPTNLYGPGDNFDLQTSHVLPALLRKFHAAKENGATEVTVWGSGTPRREFLLRRRPRRSALLPHGALRFARDHQRRLGRGRDDRRARGLIADVVGFRGAIVFDRSKPDGTPRKLLDVGKIRALGWQARTPLADGIRATYEWYLANAKEARAG